MCWSSGLETIPILENWLTARLDLNLIKAIMDLAPTLVERCLDMSLEYCNYGFGTLLHGVLNSSWNDTYSWFRTKIQIIR